MIPLSFLASAAQSASQPAAGAASPISETSLVVVFIIMATALVFDFLNGFHDAANSIATVVSTRVLSPLQAVVWAAFWNFAAAFLFGTAVAETIGKGLVDVRFVDIHVVLAGLLGAIVWDIITWLMGLPTSSSHALFGGIAGAAVTKAGIGVLIWQGWVPLVAFMFLSPLIGLILGALNMAIVSWLFRRTSPHRVDRLFRRLQLASAAICSLGHGGNDAQKTMGIIVMLLTAVGLGAWAQPDPHSWLNSFNLLGHNHDIAWWIILTCDAAIALGTVCGGWRIVKTMGLSITKLQPVGGCCAETAAASTIIGATFAGIPISTTHAITGAILGVGSVKSIRSVRWIWGQRIMIAWILTIPCAAFMAAIAFLAVRYIF